MNQPDFFKRLDDGNDEQRVRNMLAAGEYSAPHDELAREWLRIKDAERSEAAAARSESRIEESISISRKALSISEEANDIARSQSAAAWRAARYAMYAAAIAATAAIVASKDEIFKLFP